MGFVSATVCLSALIRLLDVVHVACHTEDVANIDAATACVDSDCEDAVNETNALHLVQRRATRSFGSGNAWKFIPPISRQVMLHNKSQQGYVLELQDGQHTISFECISGYAGRVTAFKLNGANYLLETPTGSAHVWGSSFWTSPQSSWGWPPPAALDEASYTAEVDENAMSITLTGPFDDTLGVRVIKRFSVDLAVGAVVVNYSIERSPNNVDPVWLAPWEVSRLHSKGLTFYPSDHAPSAVYPFGVLPTTQSLGITWFNHSDLKRDNDKAFSNSSCAWQASTDGNMVFVKRFPPVPRGSAAPGEGDIEIYAMRTYTEMEVQGSYGLVSASQPLTWTVHWYLRALPHGVPAAVGDPNLVAFVEGIGVSA